MSRCRWVISRPSILRQSLCGQRTTFPLSILTERVAGLYIWPGETPVGRMAEFEPTQTDPRACPPARTGCSRNEIENAITRGNERIALMLTIMARF
jgi:hypothetical protein